MNKRFASIAFKLMMLVSLVAAVSCERRPLNELNNQILLKLRIELKVMNSVELPEPEVMRIVLFDPETGRKVTEDYVPSEGGYISVPPGDYKMIVYNFDTEATLIRNDSQYTEIEAYTNEISSALKSKMYNAISKSTSLIKAAAQTKADEDSTSFTSEDFAWAKAMDDLQNSALIYEPDHLFVARQDITILNTSGEQVIETKAESVVETYYLSVNVKNIKNMASATALLTGQIASNKIGYEKEEGKTNTNVTLYFNMKASEENNESHDKIEATFNTFGKLPDAESRLWLTIVITNTDGTTVEWHKDITDEFNDNPLHWIEIVEDEIVIPDVGPGQGGGSTGNGGFQPGVAEWEEEHHTILI